MERQLYRSIHERTTVIPNSAEPRWLAGWA